jgi:hypothetical protein
MPEQPDGATLLAAVAHFLRREAAPALQDRLAFHARVAANALDIAAREWRLGQTAQDAARARLTALLCHDGPIAALNGELCTRIASDAIDPADPALLDHLWQTTLDALAIDQPSYATYRATRGQENQP